MNLSDYSLYTYLDHPGMVVVYHLGTFAICPHDHVADTLPLIPNYSSISLNHIGAGEYLGTLDQFPELLI